MSVSATPTSAYAISFDDVLAAARRIAPVAYTTPVLTCSTLDALAGRELFLKCENLQKGGAFKFRGALNAVMKLSDAAAAKGVVTHSSGNHAQAVALAAKMRRIAAHIVVPRTTPGVKKRAIVGYGANLVECEPTLASREQTAAALAAQTGATFIHPYNNADVMAGQGTAALELLDEVSDLDAIIAPVSGGGLISGTAIAARGARPSVRVFAAEPAGADDAARSKAAGQRLPQPSPNTICDGLMGSLGDLTWPIVRDHVEAVLTADDPSTIAAMRLLFERAKLVVEPSGAIGVAVAISQSLAQLPQATSLRRVGIILSGGNVDLDRLPWIAP